jgi:hypothetical protein
MWYFMTWKTWDILQDTKTELCKTHKTGTALGKQVNGMYTPNYILLLNIVVVTEN